MPVPILTDTAVKSAAPLPNGFREIRDGRVVGLALRVMPSGSKVWSLRYKAAGAAKHTRLTIGGYPEMSLAAARAKAQALRGGVRAGKDPAAKERIRKEAARVKVAQEKLTVGKLVEVFTARYVSKLAASSAANIAGYLNRGILPYWGDRPARSIAKSEAVLRLAEIAEKSGVSANRTRSVLVTLFSFAVDEGLLGASPMVGVKKPYKEKAAHVGRTLSDEELRVLWFAIEKAPLADGIRRALQVLCLSGQRPGDICGLELSELHDLDDPSEARAEIAAHRYKTRKKHVLPLTGRALAIVNEALVARETPIGLDGERLGEGETLFGSKFHSVRTIQRHSLSQALKRIVNRLDSNGPYGAVVRRLRAYPPTPHSFRRSCATTLSRLGVSLEDRQAILGHTSDTVMAQFYDAYDRYPQKRSGLLAYDAHIERVLTGRKPPKMSSR